MSEVKIGDSDVVAHFDENGNIELRSSTILAIDVYQDSKNLSLVRYCPTYTTMNGSVLHIRKKKTKIKFEIPLCFGSRYW